MWSHDSECERTRKRGTKIEKVTTFDTSKNNNNNKLINKTKLQMIISKLNSMYKLLNTSSKTKYCISN